MQVVLFCGGKGTRLRELTEDLPKPLVEVGAMPVLWHLMMYFAHQGFTDFIICLGYKGELIKEYFEKNPENWNITFVETGVNATKSERLQQTQKYITSDNFIVGYGDDLSNIDMKKVYDLHQQQKKIVTLNAIPLRSAFGILELDEEDCVSSFREKPRLEGFWFNGGFFVLNKKIFEYLHKGELEDEVFAHLAKEKQIFAHKHEGFWKSMNTFKDTIELNELWANKKCPWCIWNSDMNLE